jgi:hypothetical protein
MTVKSKRLHYLLSLGRVREDWAYDAGSATDDAPLISYRKQQTLFPFWTSNTRDDPVSGEYLKTSSLLGILYDTRHEKETLETKDHDYVRKRILWRLYHYEKLNGDVSKDIFPAITVDSYKNGYYKFSVFWRLFRYEKDPESQRTRLDLLFLPLKR